MEKGKIIFLYGLTSTGKTSIVEAIQENSAAFFYVVANDLFVEMVGEKYLDEDYWKYEAKAIYLMYHAAKLFSDMGKNVLIDGNLPETPELPGHYELVKRLFSDSPFYLVEVSCPLEVCRQRNVARGDRGEFQSHEQAAVQTQGICPDLTVYTDRNTPEECAKIIMKAFVDGNGDAQ